MIRAGIIGGGGYTAGELIRILWHHPEVELVFVQSESQQGKWVSDIHEDLLGECALLFVREADLEVDVLFLCMGHGRSKAFLETSPIPEKTVIIDLSSDFRLKANDHSFVYGLPELNRSEIRQCNRIANCGCFATAIQLALLPLAKAKLLNVPVHINAITGATGAGQSPGPTVHFSWRNNNMSVYKAFQHQHLGEIRQSLLQLQQLPLSPLYFIPMRGDFARGIFATLHLQTDRSIDELTQLYTDFYASHPFVVLSPRNINLKQVVNTNKALIYLEKHDDQLMILSAIDNLLKGASGQAVQNMNIRFGLEETLGLHLKAMAF